MTSIHQVGDDDHKHYAFQASRGPFTVFVSGERVHLRAMLSYEARGFYKPLVGPTLQAGCGSVEGRPRIQVEIVTPISLDSTWHLRARTRLARLEPATATDADRCKVSILHYDVTDQVVNAARQGITAQLSGIDRKIAGVSLAGQATGWWASINRPIRLRDDVWLLLAPERLRVGRITGAGHVLT